MTIGNGIVVLRQKGAKRKGSKMSLADFTSEFKYQWVCTCGRRGEFMSFRMACASSDRHIKRHETKLNWLFETELQREVK